MKLKDLIEITENPLELQFCEIANGRKVLKKIQVKNTTMYRYEWQFNRYKKWCKYHRVKPSNPDNLKKFLEFYDKVSWTKLIRKSDY